MTQKPERPGGLPIVPTPGTMRERDTDRAPYRAERITRNPAHSIHANIFNTTTDLFLTHDVSLARWLYIDQLDAQTVNGNPTDFRVGLGDSSFVGETGGFNVSVGLFLKSGGFRKFTIVNYQRVAGRAVRVLWGSDPDMLIVPGMLATRYNFGL